jgi:carbon monoxide dehydrogenase subunit G
MELTNDFRVAVPVERAWAVLTDVELIAPCLPGAQLQEVEGDEYRGVVKVKVGPITAQYKGKATFVSQDADSHTAVLRAEGRETRGQGNANATITATLTADEGGTQVSVVTDLAITGKVAQFGRGVLANVSAKLLDQFVENLEQTVLVDESEPSPGGTEDVVEPEDPIEVVQPDAVDIDDAVEPSRAPVTPVMRPGTEVSAVRRIDQPEPEPVDLVSTAGSEVARRVGPVLAIVAALWILRTLLRRRKH